MSSIRCAGCLFQLHRMLANGCSDSTLIQYGTHECSSCNSSCLVICWLLSSCLLTQAFLSFRALRRSRHHCRLCGGIFCAACSSKALLLPPKFQKSEPQRLCDPCAVLLEPLQPFLAGRQQPTAAQFDHCDSKEVQCIYFVRRQNKHIGWFVC